MHPQKNAKIVIDFLVFSPYICVHFPQLSSMHPQVHFLRFAVASPLVDDDKKDDLSVGPVTVTCVEGHAW